MARTKLQLIAALNLLSSVYLSMAGGLYATGAVGAVTGAQCSACVVFELLAPPPEFASPPLSFFDGIDNDICYDAYSNLTMYLDQPLFEALDFGLISDLISGFTNGDHSCGSDSIMSCARFASKADASRVQETIRQGAEQVMANYFCPKVPGSYGFRARSSNGAPGGECFPLDVSVVCQPPRGPFPNLKCSSKTQGAAPLRLAPFVIAGPGRGSKTLLHCFNIIRRPVVQTGPCAFTGLSKVEIWADDTKRSLVKGTRVTKNRGMPAWGSPSWDVMGKNTLKVTPLNWTVSDAIGSEICVELSTDIQQMSNLCLGDSCYISLFNKERDCCPTYRVATAPSPPPPDYYTTFP